MSDTLRNPLAVAALLAGTLVLGTALLGPVIWGEAAETNDFTSLDQPASAAHPFGTDKLGRDILARVLVAARLSIGLAVAATAIGMVLGVLVGAVASMSGRRLRRFLAMMIGIAVAFPGLLLALFFAVIFGVGPRGAVLALGFAMAPGFARLTQTLAASVTSQDYVSAARALGVSRVRILVRHVLPNLAEPLIVNGTVAAGSALLAFAGLSYLGLGVQPPAYDWGRMLSEGLNSIYTNPSAALGPALAIVVSGLAFNFAGEFAAQTVGGRARVHRKVPAHVPADAGPRLSTSSDDAPGTVLSVRDLTVRIPTADGLIRPVRGVDLDLAPGEAVGVLGESGSGKSLTALAISRLTHDPVRVDAQRLTFDGMDLRGRLGATERTRLGTSLSMVFQDPMSSLNPTMRAGDQLAEVATEHQGSSWRDARARAVERLRAVRMSAAERRSRQLPHELSGGMRQRVMIAMGLMGDPRLIIADEPTTALDVTVQQQVLEVIQSTRERTGAALLLISHDISVVSSICDRVLVMYAGRVVEDLPVADLERARHPYTRALVEAVPTMQTPRDERLSSIPGRPPDPAALPTGCPFAPRCPRADTTCTIEPPLVRYAAGSGAVACHHPVEETS
ncbi:dipeptide/oligopeptide/nickel ABC transporter permease/ATP-binding protein [uncultured Serinicoccus sp.]|uniref:dipeptide/oligopeptide/nickel ABC transporter permease/ATP-binding protein n=1 Tax=uncultured Serinicoccus sp. TaxID=735514 RepID=UPI0026266FB2|nr:dipeptide/oligopeptide/nickel ABC transporter permease/ATP-binding protein [uncultured Serinicoccus sp.]